MIAAALGNYERAKTILEQDPIINIDANDMVAG